MKQGIEHLAACASTPDVGYLFHMLAGMKMQVYLIGKMESVWDCILADHSVSELLKHAA